MWLLWGTGLYTARAQDNLREDLARRIAEPRFHGALPQDMIRKVHFDGDAWAILRIPTIDVDVVSVQGTSSVDLKQGPGHYINTAWPWEKEGTVGIAGHRTTYGAPFWSLDEVENGDPIRLVTEFGVFVYRVKRTEEVPPTAVAVLRRTGKPMLVLTTCAPRFSATKRLILFAERVGSR